MDNRLADVLERMLTVNRLTRTETTFKAPQFYGNNDIKYFIIHFQEANG